MQSEKFNKAIELKRDIADCEYYINKYVKLKELRNVEMVDLSANSNFEKEHTRIVLNIANETHKLLFHEMIDKLMKLEMEKKEKLQKEFEEL